MPNPMLIARLRERFPDIRGNALKLFAGFYSCEGAVEVRDLCELMGFRESTITKALGALERRGVVGRVGNGWMLTVDAPQPYELQW